MYNGQPHLLDHQQLRNVQFTTTNILIEAFAAGNLSCVVAPSALLPLTFFCSTLNDETLRRRAENHLGWVSNSLDSAQARVVIAQTRCLVLVTSCPLSLVAADIHPSPVKTHIDKAAASTTIRFAVLGVALGVWLPPYIACCSTPAQSPSAGICKPKPPSPPRHRFCGGSRGVCSSIKLAFFRVLAKSASMSTSGFWFTKYIVQLSMQLSLPPSSMSAFSAMSACATNATPVSLSLTFTSILGYGELPWLLQVLMSTAYGLRRFRRLGAGAAAGPINVLAVVASCGVTLWDRKCMWSMSDVP